MQKVWWGLGFLVCFLLCASMGTAQTTNAQEYCQTMLGVYSWKEVTFPDSLSFSDGLVSVIDNEPAGYVQIKNNSIVAAGCATITEADYILSITPSAATLLLSADDSLRMYKKLKRQGEITLVGKTAEAKKTVRRLHWQAFLWWLY